jgi:hypothetical protein
MKTLIDPTKSYTRWMPHHARQGLIMVLILLISLLFSLPGRAESLGLSADELEKLVAPVALYPDELLAIVLPSTTKPIQIVQAARFLVKHEKNKDLKPDSNWDVTVLGLLNYPDILNKMNDDLDWTTKLGDAFTDQQPDVMNAVQQYRSRVKAAGNLESDEKRIVIQEKEIIKIVSVDPKVVYVPVYDPQVVVVKTYYATPTVVYHYTTYPAYYDPTATFIAGMFVGGAIAYGFDWHHHSVYHGHYDDVYDDVRDLQNDRYNKARDLQEDRQDFTKEQQEKRETARDDRKETASDKRGEAQKKREDSGKSDQLKQRSQDSSRQKSGTQNRKASTQQWQSQKRKSSSTGAAPTFDRSWADSRSSGSRARLNSHKQSSSSRNRDAFSGYKRGGNTSRSSTRGSQSVKRSRGGSSGRQMNSGRSRSNRSGGSRSRSNRGGGGRRR